MFRISRANLVGAVAGFLLYAVFSSVINHLTSTQHISIPIDRSVHVELPNSISSFLYNTSDTVPRQSTDKSTHTQFRRSAYHNDDIIQTSTLSSTIAGCSQSENEDFCDSYARKNGIIPLENEVLHDKNFAQFKEQWLHHNCDNFFKHKRICTAPVPKCSRTGDDGQPLIAILAATTTRRVKKPTIQKIALFTLLLPSLVRTLDCGFRYVYVMGYDMGDPYYDNKKGLGEVVSWFSREIEQPMKEQGISIRLATVRVDNKVKKPGPVFLAMARHAYGLGAEFFYRVNDDTEFRGHWPKAFTEALMSLTPPYGVIGPASLTSNLVILTHDFVHRTHMDIMQTNYYPTELPDWWMDNWISRVYGKHRTFYSEDAVVMHHTYAHGQRYEVNRQNQKHLPVTLQRGRRLILSWMHMNNASSSDIQEFERDHSYKGTFKFTEIKSLKPKLK